MMLSDLIFEFKSWWLGATYHGMEMDEFERLESKHTRVHHDENIYEEIRVH